MQGGGSTPASAVKRGRLEALERRHATSSPVTPQVLKFTPKKTTWTKSTSKSKSKGAAPTAATPAVYAPLDRRISEGEVGTRLLQQVERGDVRSILKQVWGNREGMDGAVERMSNNAFLLDNPPKKVTAAAAARDRRLSHAGHRHLGSFRLSPAQTKYHLYTPMRSMWRDYINQLVDGACDDTVLQSRLLTCELHGAELQVVDSTNKSFVGVKGIMIRETENTFGIITEADKFKVVPKAGSIFVLHLDNMRVTLFGNNLVPERTLRRQPPAKKLRGTTTTTTATTTIEL